MKARTPSKGQTQRVNTFPASGRASGAAKTAAAVAEPFALSQVELLDSPFLEARERIAKYLLSLDPDRLLHNTRQLAGLQP